MTRATAYLLVSLLLAGCPGEQSVNPQNELEKTREQATQGNAKAQFILGNMYDNGAGVPEDPAQAVFWYRKAAEQGLADAQFILGEMYERGYSVGRGALDKGGNHEQQIVVPEDPIQAAFWLRKAAEQGLDIAQLKLATMYAKGHGVPADPVQAVFWLRKAAEKGLADAQNSLGSIYNLGYGVPKDYTLAALWYRKAAEQGDDDAQLNLGYIYERGNGVPKDEIEAYAWYNIASVSHNKAKMSRDNLEETMTPDARMRAQARTRELQKLIEERKAAKGK